MATIHPTDNLGLRVASISRARTADADIVAVAAVAGVIPLAVPTALVRATVTCVPGPGDVGGGSGGGCCMCIVLMLRRGIMRHARRTRTATRGVGGGGRSG